MIYRMLFFSFVLANIIIMPVKAQLSAQKDAVYFALVKAVADYKINDEENTQQLKQLREDKRFNEKLNKMMEKLNNDKSKNSTNRRIYNILRQAGKQIYNELN